MRSESAWLSTAEAAKLLRKTLPTVRAWYASGRLEGREHVTPGGRRVLRLDRASVESLLPDLGSAETLETRLMELEAYVRAALSDDAMKQVIRAQSVVISEQQNVITKQQEAADLFARANAAQLDASRSMARIHEAEQQLISLAGVPAISPIIPKDG